MPRTKQSASNGEIRSVMAEVVQDLKEQLKSDLIAQLPAVIERAQPPAPAMELSVEQVKARMDAIKQLMQEQMIQGVDYGKIPGTGEKGKPTLLKAGMEKLCVMFRLDPRCTTTPTFFPDGHMACVTVCEVYSQVSGQRLGGSTRTCSTKEAKYAYRQGDRLCPKCGKATIIKGRAEYGGGWLCFAKKGGCGAKFAENAPEITSQKVGRQDNPDLPDVYNTVMAICEKRAQVAATRLVTGASAIFDEEMPESEDTAPADDAGLQARFDDAQAKKESPKAEPERQAAAQEALKTAETKAETKATPKEGMREASAGGKTYQYEVVTAEQAAEIEGWCKELGYDPEDVLSQANTMITGLKAKTCADVPAWYYAKLKGQFETARARAGKGAA